LVALILWCVITLGCLSFFFTFAVGVALGPMEARWLVIPSLLILLALGFLALAYYLLVRNSKKWIKIGFIAFLIAPHTLFGGYTGYIATRILAAPYFTTHVTKTIELRLDLDELNRPVFFFSEYHIKNGFNYDPYRKYILKYPESIFKLSEQKQRLNGTMVIAYTYKKAARFWLTHIGGYPVKTNRIDGSFIPPRLAVIKDDR
jgi:hypothetical protein